MAKDPAYIIEAILLAAGVGTTNLSLDWSTHVTATAPENPDNVIIIKNTGGFQSLPTWLLDYPTVQIMVRGNQNNEDNVRLKIQEVKQALLGIPAQDVLGDRVDGIIQLNDVADLPRDLSNRPRCTYEIQIFLEPAPDGSYRQSL